MNSVSLIRKEVNLLQEYPLDFSPKISCTFRVEQMACFHPSVNHSDTRPIMGICVYICGRGQIELFSQRRTRRKVGFPHNKIFKLSNLLGQKVTNVLVVALVYVNPIIPI